MKANTKWTIAALVALAAATVHTLHAQAIGPMSAHDSDAAGSTRSKTYADWQGPLTQSFGIRFLAPRTAWDPIARGASQPELQPADIRRLGENAGLARISMTSGVVSASRLLRTSACVSSRPAIAAFANT